MAFAAPDLSAILLGFDMAFETALVGGFEAALASAGLEGLALAFGIDRRKENACQV